MSLSSLPLFSNPYTAPCIYCTHVEVDSGKEIIRTVQECKYREGMYCCVCMAYRHLSKDCPDKVAWAIRNGESLEGVKNIVLRVENSKKGVEDILKLYKVPTGSKDIENRKRLRHLANSMNPPRLVEFIRFSK